MREEGFSLIEMLVVIAIIAIAMVATLTAIDPLEQIRKARDAARIKEAGDLLKGYAKYFAAYKCYPWDTGAPTCTGVDNSRLLTATVPDFSVTGVDYDLITQGQLKESFANKRSIQRNEFLVSVNDERRVAVCYEPESRKSRGGNFLGLMDNINQTPDADRSCDDIRGYPDNSCFICVGF
jgi:prepilin-type N-terminal cleavage/methylation domain-containing protein